MNQNNFSAYQEHLAYPKFRHAFQIIFAKEGIIFTSMRRSLAPLPRVVEEACARDKVNIC